MLKLHFINVADGDSMLLEYTTRRGVYRALVDTGRALPSSEPGSLCLSCADYLSQQCISYIDDLIITHLHFDHFEGIEGLFEAGIRFGRLWSGYLAPAGAGYIHCGPAEEKTVRGNIDALNLWRSDLDLLAGQGTGQWEISSEVPFSPANGLQMTIYPPKETYYKLQHRVWDSYYLGDEELSAEDKYKASKSRNPGSLRILLQAYGRSVVLGGDCYGEEWTDWKSGKCDIFKVPHHSDAKSMTAELAALLSPEHAVISCSAVYMPNKDRPSASAAELLRNCGAELWVTDCFAGEWNRMAYRDALVFTILEDGSILPPENI